MENKNQKGNSKEFKADEIDKRFEMNTSFPLIAETELPQQDNPAPPQANPAPQEPPTNDANSRHSPENETNKLKQRSTGEW